MRFRFFKEPICEFTTNRICQIMDVNERGMHAYRSHPASRRQRTDLVVLAHIREQFALSLGSYGRPRMTEELQELGLPVGHRRIGHLMRDNGFRVSKSGKGNCYDNAAAETFFKSIKAELIWRSSWQTRRKAKAAIFKYINGFYNLRLRHSALGWESPVAFERKVT